MSDGANTVISKKEIQEMAKIRKQFAKEFSDSDFKELITGGRQLDLLEGMKNFREEKGIQSLKNTLAFKNSMKGRREIVEIFESYLDKGLPDRSQYLKDMSKIRKRFKDDSVQRPDEYDVIAKYMTAPPVSPPSMTPEETIESGKMIKDEKREKMMADKDALDIRLQKAQEGIEESMRKRREKEAKEKEEEEEIEEIDISTNPNADPSSSSSSTSPPRADIPDDMPVPQSIESHTMPDGSVMSGESHSKSSKVMGKKSEPYVLPTKMDSIPPSRLSSSFKDVEDLNDDIKYFFKNFGSLLKTEKGIYKKIGKTDKPNLIKLHSRIVGKLSPKIPDDRSKGKKMGVVIDAQDYIRQEMKRLMENNTFSNMSPSDVIVDVGYNEESNDPDVKDYGDFEVKRNSEGGLSSRRESIYRYQPTEGKDEVGLEGVPERKKRKPRRLANIPLKEINEATTAKRMVRRNPFSRNVKTVKLKYLY